MLESSIMEPSRMRAFPGPLRDKRFRTLWIGQTLSFAGSAVFPVALTLALVKGEGSVSDLGLILAAGIFAEGAFLLIGGVWGDRLPRQKVMLAADAVRCVGHVLIGMGFIYGEVDTHLLVVVSALVGAAGGFFRPASSGLIPATVEPEVLQEANALMAVSKRTAMLIGPAIATALTLSMGVGWAMILDGATFAVSMITLAILKIPHTPLPRRRFISDLREGWDEVRGRTWLWSNLVVHGMWNLARTAYFTVGAMVVITRLGGDISWGIVTQGATLGAFAGALIALRVRPRRPLVVSNVCLALGAIPIALIGAEANVWLIAITAALMTLALGLMGTLWDTTVQQEIPDEMLSRVSSYDWLMSTVLSPVGMALAGPLALGVGTAPVLYGAAGLMVVSCLGVLALRDVRTLSPRPVGSHPAEEANDEVPAGN